MGARQSIQGPTMTNDRRKNMPVQTSCSNDITCQNYDFSFQNGGFACPGASCGSNGKCDCGPNCTPLRGTCCREVIWDPGMRTYKCQELTELQTKSPSVIPDGVTSQPLPEYDPYDLDVTYRPISPAPTPTVTTQPFIEDSCLVSDKFYQGVVVPGKVICEWYNSA